MDYKQQKFIAHKSGGRKSKIKALTGSVPDKDLISNLEMATATMLLHVEEERNLSGASFVRSLIPFMRDLPSRSNQLLKAPLPNTTILRVRILTYEF